MKNFKQARTNMVDCQIETAGVVSRTLIEAFDTVPRECFVPEHLQSVAYSDEDLKISDKRYLMEPMVHARLVEALEPSPQDVVLDIGCANGYSSAILSSLVTTVIALENSEEYLDQAAKLWKKQDVCNVVGVQGELPKGNAKNAPYDLIIINGAIESPPQALLEQLAPEGKLGCIVKEKGQALGKAILIQALGDDSYSSFHLFEAGCPYLEGFEPGHAFQF